MDDVLDLYAEPPDSNRPVVCFDESPTQLIGEIRQPVPAAPGQPYAGAGRAVEQIEHCTKARQDKSLRVVIHAGYLT
jgi:hypothetical protein